MADLLVRDVHQTLGTVHILKGASFTAERGRITALLGASGSGKTTLLRAVAGLEQPQGGRIEIAGQVVLDSAAGVAPPPERRGHSRYSMPFFLHPAPDFLIETLPSTITRENPNRYPTPFTAHDYLHERLVEIGLVKK